jgi:hypothetical protein
LIITGASFMDIKYNSLKTYIMNLTMFSEALNALIYQKLTESLRASESKMVLDNTSHLQFINYIERAWQNFMSYSDDQKSTMVAGLQQNIIKAYKFMQEDIESIDKLDIYAKEETKQTLLKNQERLGTLLKLL